MTIRDELLSGRAPQAVFAKDGLLDALKKALAERVLKPSWTITWRRSAPSIPLMRLATTATAIAARRCWAARAGWRSPCRVTGRRASNRS